MSIVNNDENAKNLTGEGKNTSENNQNIENKGEIQASKPPQDTTTVSENAPDQPPSDDDKTTDKKKRRPQVKYIPSIDIKTLKELEGATFNSFVDLAKAVVFTSINGKKTRYDESVLPMSKARKIDLERLIAHHAQLIVYGTRKYQIKSVISRKQKEEFNDVELEIIRDRLYDETTHAKKKREKKDTDKDKGKKDKDKDKDKDKNKKDNATNEQAETKPNEQPESSE